MKNQVIQIKKTIRGLRKIRRKLPKEWGTEEIKANSWALDYLEENLFKKKTNST